MSVKRFTEHCKNSNAGICKSMYNELNAQTKKKILSGDQIYVALENAILGNQLSVLKFLIGIIPNITSEILIRIFQISLDRSNLKIGKYLIETYPEILETINKMKLIASLLSKDLQTIRWLDKLYPRIILYITTETLKSITIKPNIRNWLLPKIPDIFTAFLNQRNIMLFNSDDSSDDSSDDNLYDRSDDNLDDRSNDRSDDSSDDIPGDIYITHDIETGDVIIRYGHANLPLDYDSYYDPNSSSYYEDDCDDIIKKIIPQSWKVIKIDETVDIECPVCFEESDSILGCNHIMCYKCVSELLTNECPLCRCEIKECAMLEKPAEESYV